MRYMLLIYTNQAEDAARSQEEQGAIWQQYMEYTADLHARGAFLAGDALTPVGSATTVRLRSGETLATDGPFAETKEQLGGYYLVQCADLDEALELAAKLPAAAFGSVEVRPVLDLG